MLDLPTLTRMVDADEIDTVLVVFPDLQGRLVGKRVTGHYFLDHVVDGGIECCNYLLAVDVDMTCCPATSSRTGTRATATSPAAPTSRRSASCRGSKAPRSSCATCSTTSRGRRSRSHRGGSCNARSNAPHAVGLRRHVRVELEFFLFRECSTRRRRRATATSRRTRLRRSTTTSSRRRGTST